MGLCGGFYWKGRPLLCGAGGPEAGTFKRQRWALPLPAAKFLIGIKFDRFPDGRLYLLGDFPFWWAIWTQKGH